MTKSKTSIKIIGGIILIFLINVMSSYIYKRFDITQDQRYTLNEASKNTVTSFNAPVIVDVFLAGELPAEFKRLQIETRQLLEEFQELNPNIIVNFINPRDENPNLDQVEQQMIAFGLTPARVDMKQDGKISQQTVFPWAVINHQKRLAKVQLLKRQSFGVAGQNASADRINNSVQSLEYAFANGFKTVGAPPSKKIAYLLGNDQLPSKHVYDFLKTLENNYGVIPVTLDSAATRPIETLKNLMHADLTIIAKPNKRFTAHQKYILDQYIVNGGKSMWLVDAAHADMDSLQLKGKTLAWAKDLNLTDQFFQYGFRINPELVKDLYATDIMLVDDAGQANRYPWFFNPLVIPSVQHEIVTNIPPIKLEFTNTIDLLKQGMEIKKTPLLVSSPASSILGLPAPIDFSEINPNKRPDLSKFNQKHLILAALLEGRFQSAFKNRVKPFNFDQHKDQDRNGAMIVVADGDIIKNQLDKDRRPLELGLDKYTGQRYGNKEFLLNAVNYLLDDTGLIKVRNKEVKIPLLDVERLSKEKQKWQIINIIVPLVILFFFGIAYYLVRKRKYAA